MPVAGGVTEPGLVCTETCFGIERIIIRMIRFLLRLFPLACLLLAAACSTPPKPQQQQSGFEIETMAEQGEQQIVPDNSTSQTVLALLDSAQSAAQSGQLHNAEAQLERALRIEPRNAALWHYMAKLRLHQNRLSEAAGLAAKSNTLAGQNRALRADNWRIIAHARQQQGDEAGAMAAQRKVDSLSK